MGDAGEYNRKLLEEAIPRAERVAKLRAAGETWAAIGTLLGVTAQRAQQIHARHLKRNGREK